MDDNATKILNPFYELDLKKGQKIYLETDSAKVFGTFESFNVERSKIDIAHVKTTDGLSLGRTKFYSKHQVYKIQLCGENEELLEVPLIKEKDPFEENTPKYLLVPKKVKVKFGKIAENYKFFDNPDDLKTITEDLLSNQLVGVAVELVEQRINLLVLTTWNQIYIVDKKAVTDLSFLIPVLKSDVITKVAYDGSFFRFFEKKYECKAMTTMNLKAAFNCENVENLESYEKYVELMLQISLEENDLQDSLNTRPLLKETLLQVAKKWVYLLQLHHTFLHSTVLREFRKISEEYAYSHVKEEDCDVGISFTKPENFKLKEVMEKHSNYKLPLKSVREENEKTKIN